MLSFVVDELDAELLDRGARPDDAVLAVDREVNGRMVVDEFVLFQADRDLADFGCGRGWRLDPPLAGGVPVAERRPEHKPQQQKNNCGSRTASFVV